VNAANIISQVTASAITRNTVRCDLAVSVAGVWCREIGSSDPAPHCTEISLIINRALAQVRRHLGRRRSMVKSTDGYGLSEIDSSRSCYLQKQNNLAYLPYLRLPYIFIFTPHLISLSLSLSLSLSPHQLSSNVSRLQTSKLHPSN